MDLPRGLVESLGGDGPSKEGPESTDDESMLEQHVKAFFRAGNAGKFSLAADSLKAAWDECGAMSDEEGASDEGDPNEGSEADEY